jgi:polyhydroxybutyrate depolymerase
VYAAGEVGSLKPLWILLALLSLGACKHPLAVQGEGDIVELLTGERGCTLAQSQAGSTRCRDNEVSGEDYAVSYQAIPHPGWAFSRWRGTPCGAQPQPDLCDYAYPQLFVDYMDEVLPGYSAPETVAVFEPVSGNTVVSGHHTGLTLMHDGVLRNYDLYVPPAYDGSAPVPLVIDVHGSNRSGLLQKLASGFDAVADAHPFIVAYPNGTSMNWNIGVCCSPASDSGVDDVGFLRALVTRIKSEAVIDPRRVYVTGWSAGGGMAARAICDAPEVFAAAALFASMTQVGELCLPSRPIPVMSLHAIDDAVVPFSGGSFQGSVPVLDQRDILAFFLDTNRCRGSSRTEELATGTRCELHEACGEGSQVALCTTDSAGFNGHDVYHNDDGVDLAQRAWNFLRQFEAP